MMVSKPWLQLVTGILCMAMIANLQYGWTLFVDPIDAKHQWGRSAIQIAFTIFVFSETWLVPIKSWFVDRHSPRLVAMTGGVLVMIAWIINSVADSLPMLYFGAFVGGAGAAAVYGTCVGNALKWFPQSRGFAAGCTAAGFGAGAALTIIPIGNSIAANGYEATFLYFGIGQGVIILLAATILRKPSAEHMANVGTKRVSTISHKPAVVLRTPVFWVMYATFVLVAAGGLTAAAQIAPIARDFNIDKVPVDMLGFQLSTLAFALALDRIFDGFGRPFFGFVSDRIGREVTMAICFVLAAVSLGAVSEYGQIPLVFVFGTAFFFLFFGEIYSLFPATCGDTFGSTYAATNAGLLYTAKGTASLLVPLANIIAMAHSWRMVFLISIGCTLTAAFLAFFVLRPLRAKFMAERCSMPEAPAAIPAASVAH
jgi:MFS transporter, OFA family, oxalate/formate antiporter